MSKIDSRKSQIPKGRTNEVRRQSISPTRKGAFAAFSVLAAVGVGSQIEVTGNSRTEVIPVHQGIDTATDLTPEPATPEPGSVEAFRLAQEIIDPTSPDESQRRVGEVAARELISPEEN